MKYRSWTYSTYYCNVPPHMTLNIITRRGSVSQNVCISLKLNTIFSQGNGEERESFWNTVGAERSHSFPPSGCKFCRPHVRLYK